MPTCGHRVMVAITDAVARPTVGGTRRYTHTRTPLMRMRVCGWLRVSAAVAGAATEVPRVRLQKGCKTRDQRQIDGGSARARAFSSLLRRA